MRESVRMMANHMVVRYLSRPQLLTRFNAHPRGLWSVILPDAHPLLVSLIPHI
jgi:hypothetical protein